MPLVLDDPAVGTSILLTSLFCLGSWPALFELCLLRGRHPIHVYLDYTVAILLVSCMMALTLGTFGEKSKEHPSFLEQLAQANLPLVGAAVFGGMMLMIGNFSLQRSLVMGVPLTTVLPVQGSMTVVIGTTANYFLQPHRNDPQVLFAGVGAFVLAIILSTCAHLEHAQGMKRQADLQDLHAKLLASPSDSETSEASYFVETAASEKSHALEEVDSQLPSTAGLAVTIGGGLAFGFFAPAFNIAVNDEFGWLRDKGTPPLTVWTANFYFDMSFALTALVLNWVLMHWPPPGSSSSSLWKYVADGKGRPLALAAGAVCGFGNAAQFLGGSASGFASADLVQAFPLVGTAWGIFFFGEFRGASRRVILQLVAMYNVYLAAVILLAASVKI